MFWVYNALFLLLSPIWAPMMWWKNRTRPDKVDWKERQGAFPIEPRWDRKRIWVHAVSVGEVIAAKPILMRVRAKLPDFEIVVTCTTGTGHKTAKEQLSDTVDAVYFFPIDVVRFMFNAMQRVQPSVVVVMETELWMNFLAMSKQFGATTLLINGRISDRSFARSKWIRPLMKAIVRHLDRALMQTRLDADRILAYGSKSAEVYGNSKFDVENESAGMSADEWRRLIGANEGDFVVVVGSTRGAEEEAFVFEALESLELERLFVVYAPRHMDRVDAIEVRAAKKFATGRRSKGESAPFLILDTYGELADAYACADVAVIGGGFANLGGQNLLQPLGHGVPVLHGPHMQNFAEATALALEFGASRQVDTPQELAEAIAALRNDDESRLRISEAARRMMASNSGASERYAEAIVEAAEAFQSKYAARLAQSKPVHSSP